jgi:SAM-dependent methyltransferase
VSAPRIFTPEYYGRMRALEGGAWWNAGMRRIAERLLVQAGLSARGTALDVGCASGQTLEWLRSVLPAWSAVGVDVSAPALDVARRARHAVLRATALALPVRDQSVDLVVTLDVLQHLPLRGGDCQALREMRRVLRRGGLLLLRTNAQAMPRTADDPGASFHKYAVHELRTKLESCGLTVLRLSRVNALLGLAEIPRELRARREAGDGYHGLLATPRPGRPVADAWKRRWLELEGRAVARGVRLPIGRTIIGVCRG